MASSIDTPKPDGLDPAQTKKKAPKSPRKKRAKKDKPKDPADIEGLQQFSTQFLSMRAYARYRGCDEKAVRRAVRESRIQLIKKGSKNLIDVEAADEIWPNQNPVKQAEAQKAFASPEMSPAGAKLAKRISDMVGNDVGEELLSPLDAKLILDTYKAKLARLDYDEREGTLIPVEEARNQAITAAQLTRSAVLNIPAKISAEIAAITDPHKVQIFLEKELTGCLTELADYEHRF